MIATGEDADEDGGENEHDKVDDVEVFGGDGAGDGDRKSKNDTDVEDVATDDVANEEVGFFFAGSSDSGDEFWKRSAEGDNGERDNAFGDTNGFSDGTGRVDDELATADDANESEDD